MVRQLISLSIHWNYTLGLLLVKITFDSIRIQRLFCFKLSLRSQKSCDSVGFGSLDSASNLYKQTFCRRRHSFGLQCSLKDILQTMGFQVNRHLSLWSLLLVAYLCLNVCHCKRHRGNIIIIHGGGGGGGHGGGSHHHHHHGGGGGGHSQISQSIT